MTSRVKIAALVAACGAAGTAAAQPTIICGSGATLYENFHRSAASTNDYLGTWDGDGTAGVFASAFPDQLAPSGDIVSPFAAGTEWIFHYRITGSGNGIRELDTFAPIFDKFADNTDDDSDTTVNDDVGNSAFSSEAIYNINDLVVSGVLQGIGNTNNRSGTIDVPDGANGYVAIAQTAAATNGFTVDFNTSDVGLNNFAIQAGAWRPDAVPGSSGYGSNPQLAWDVDGTPLGQTNLLRPLNNLNTNTQAPDANTVWSTSVSLAPVAALVNYGVGLSEIHMSDLRHLNATGRRLVGENLVCCTRDSGSGTRNAFMNGIGLDPSGGRGDNVGDRSTSSANDVLGPNYQPTNKGSSGRMDGTVQNTRLGTGHTGAERLQNNGIFADQDLDCFGVMADIKGGNAFARPTATNVISGDADGYNIIGLASFSHRGDPRNGTAEDGGWGWRNLPAVVAALGAPTAAEDESGPNPFAGNPAPPNVGLTRYMNNLRRSVVQFIAVPAGAESDFMPGEFLADNFFLVAAPDNVPTDDPTASTTTQPIPIVANPGQNAAVRADALANSTLNAPGYAAFNGNTAGRVPFRTTGNAYSDAAAPGGSATGLNYVDQGGNAVAYGSLLNLRNKIAFDFDGDGARSTADAADMVAAFVQRSGGAAWVAPAGSGPLAGEPGSEAIIEVLGDADGDGNFDENDIRYWADGLVLADNGLDVVPVTPAAPRGGSGFVIGDGNTDETLDRAAGFTAVDNASGSGNFFGTTLATGTYDAGDSRADVAGSGSTAPGWAPVGADGTVDDLDIDYVCQNFGDWQNLSTAVSIDLSCDMNADLVVDINDVEVIVEDILGTSFGDVDLDGDVDAADEAIVTGNQGLSPAGWADGDTDCDGDVDADDLLVFSTKCTFADCDANGVLNVDDIDCFVAAFLGGNLADADCDDNGVLNVDDIDCFVASFLGGCP